MNAPNVQRLSIFHSNRNGPLVSRMSYKYPNGLPPNRHAREPKPRILGVVARPTGRVALCAPSVPVCLSDTKAGDRQ